MGLRAERGREGGVQPLVTLTRTFDAVGNRVSLANDAGLAGATTAYAHDGAGRLTGLTTPAGQAVSMAYDPAGRMLSASFPNGVASAFAYDLAGRLAQLTHSRGLTELAGFAYGYSAVGNILQIAEASQTRDFAYDALQRLISGGTAASPESYAYDPEGNRTLTHLSGLHLIDTANRLTEDDDFTYAYDANGNLVSKTETATGAFTSYSWDAEDRLIRIDFPDLTFAEYRYDGLGRVRAAYAAPPAPRSPLTEKNVDGAITRARRAYTSPPGSRSRLALRRPGSLARVRRPRQPRRALFPRPGHR